MRTSPALAWLALAALVLGGSLWFVRSTRVPDSSSATPVEDVSAESTRATLRDVESDAERENAVTIAEHTAAAPVDAPTPTREATISVLARFVDRAGMPLQGVELRAESASVRRTKIEKDAADWAGIETLTPRVSSDALGRVELRSAPSVDADVVLFEFKSERADLVPTRRYERVQPHVPLDLGDVVLAHAAYVSGIVLDAQGEPVANARVKVRIDGAMQSSVLSEHDGTFVFERAPSGDVTFDASTRDGRDGGDVALTAIAGARHTGIVIRLGPPQTDGFLSVVVLDPARAPVPHARFRVERKSARGTSMQMGSADKVGRFRVSIADADQVQLRVSDPEQRWPDVRIAELDPTQREIELVFEEPSVAELVVVGSGDLDPTSFGCEFLAADSAALLREVLEAPRPEGSLRIVAEPVPFRVRVVATGFRAVELGPFAPTALPATLEAVLDPLPGIRGRVTHDGRPLQGVTISAAWATKSDQYVTVDGFEARMWSDIDQGRGAADRCIDLRVESDAEGRFMLPLACDGEIYVRATAPNFANAEHGPFTYSSLNGIDGLELVMTRGGTLEGVARTRAGEVCAGLIVGMSNGDGEPRSVRTQIDGTFRAEHLAAGRWYLAFVGDDLTPGGARSLSVDRRVNAPKPMRSVMIVDGEVTRFELTCPGALACEIRVADSIARTGKVEVWALVSGVAHDSAQRRELPFDATRAAWMLEEERAIKAHPILLLTSGAGALEYFENELDLDLATHTIDFSHGTIVGRLKQPHEAGREVRLMWSGPRDSSARATTTVQADGTFEFSVVPAGNVRVWGSSTDPVTIELHAGERVDVGEL